ncbi:Uma2 family endonuclease [Pendulispora brunnea]|uniref:Uma2 family endonuclease n=1 Tax=Pendulispora brunnea TaxID=2905690 RepID=A0ABZ2K3D6_9BACT
MERVGEVEQVQGPYTWDDLLKLDEDDLRELIDGEFVEVEVPGGPHEYVVLKLVTALENWANATEAGIVLASGYPVRISERRGVMPDAQFYARDNPSLRDQQDSLSQGHPSLAVEISSPSSRRIDRVVKFGYYASIGTPEYWIIDPVARTLDRFLLRDEQYAPVDSLGENAFFRPETLPGFELALERIWPTEQAVKLFEKLQRGPP